MVRVQHTDNGRRIGKQSIRAPLAYDSAYVGLNTHTGPDMVYDADTKQIDYPGEYDIDNVQYRVRASKDNELNYSIETATTTAVVCQTKAYLRTNELPDEVDTWILTTEKLRTYREKMELEGDVIVLETFGQESAE
jgi:hypothetical protein